MKSGQSELAAGLLAGARHSLVKHHLPRIERCLALLTEREIWWRANSKSNSVGNLVLHLNGNVRQWIISGLGGVDFDRARDEEFSEQGLIPRRTLVRLLRVTVLEAERIIARLTPDDLAQTRMIQGFNVTGLEALMHVTEHFAFHAGQIICITKMKRGRDLGFTRLPSGARGAQEGLPGERKKARAARALPAI